MTVAATLLVWSGAAGVICQSPTPSRQRFQVRPVDEAAKDLSLKAFRAELIAAVKRRDAAFVINVAEPTVQAKLQPSLDPTVPRRAGSPESEDWATLEGLLSLGGSFTTVNGAKEVRLEFCAPYTYSAYPVDGSMARITERLAGHDDVPEAGPWVILGARVPVRAEPSTSGKIVKYLSHDLVLTGDQSGTPPTWIGVYVADGIQGWVPATEIRDPNDYHACFAKVGSRWMMTEFDNHRLPWAPLKTK